MPRAKLLTESLPFYTHLTEMDERTGTLPKGLIMMARGKFAHAGKITANGRLYSRPLMRRELERLNKDGGEIKEKAMIGETDHPVTGSPSVRQSAYIVTGLGMNDEGEVLGEMGVMDTGAGRDLAACIRAGAQVGFSSRSKGTTSVQKMTSKHPEWEENQDWADKEFEEVNDDFKLVTFDAVIGPAVADAHVGDYNENHEEVVEMGIKLEDVLKDAELMSKVLESEAVKLLVTKTVEEATKALEQKNEEEVKNLMKEYLLSPEYAAQFEQDEEDTVECAECGATVPSGTKYCPECGEKLEQKKEVTQDEKDAKIDALTKKVDEMEKSNKEMASKMKESEDKVKKDAEEMTIQKIVAECLTGKPAIVAESVKKDLIGLTLTEQNAKQIVTEKIARLEEFAKQAGVPKLPGVGISIPGDLDESKPKDKDLELLDSL